MNKYAILHNAYILHYIHLFTVRNPQNTYKVYPNVINYSMWRIVGYLQNLKAQTSRAYHNYKVYCGQHTSHIMVGLFSAMVASYFNVYVNETMAKMIQGDFSTETMAQLFRFSFISICLTSLRGALFTYCMKHQNIHIKRSVYARLLRQSPVYYETAQVSTMNDLINRDADRVSEIISCDLNIIPRSVLNLVVSFYLIYTISPALCVLMACMVLFNIYMSKAYHVLRERVMGDYDKKVTNIHTFLYETLSNLSVVRAFVAEDSSLERVDTMSADVSRFYRNESILYAFNAFLNYSMPTMTMLIAILTTRYFELSANLIPFTLHFKSTYQTIQEMLDAYNRHKEGAKSYGRIMELLEREECQPKGGYEPNDGCLIPHIEFKDVCFKYTSQTAVDAPVLTNLSFVIPANAKVAIVGASGCGKSTIVRLLMGILTPTAGSICINGVNMETYGRVWLLRKFGYVQQDSVLFSDTIANNISYGMGSSCSREEIEEAARMANIDTFISRLPDGYDTRIEGTEMKAMSGGQRQRISIARALVRKPRVLIFDEATSALDPACEEVVQHTIRRCFETVCSTMIVIAHRPSALELADTIYRFEDSVLRRVYT